MIRWLLRFAARRGVDEAGGVLDALLQHPQNRYLPPIFITLILLVGPGCPTACWKASRAPCWRSPRRWRSNWCSHGWSIIGKWPVLAGAYDTGISVGILIPFRRVLAVRSDQCDRHHIEIRHSLARTASLEPFEPGDLCDAAVGAGVYRDAEYSVQGNAIWPMLVVWVLGAFIAWRGEAFPHHRDVCNWRRFSSRWRAYALRSPAIRFLARGSAHHRPHVSALHLFHDHGPEDDGEIAARPDVDGVHGGGGEMCFRLAQNVDAPYFALTVVGPIAMAIDIWRTPQKRAVAK